MVVGKTLASLANPEQFTQVLTIQIYIIKLWVDCTTNQHRANSGEHAWLKLVTTKSTWTPLQPMPVSLALAGSLSQRSYVPSLGAFQIKHLYIRVTPTFIPSPNLTLQTRAPF